MKIPFAFPVARPTVATMVGGLLVLIGFLITQSTLQHWSAYLLMAAGAFGPGILRELGLVRDQDEFKRRTAHRAGYHAFVVAGFVALAGYGLTRNHPEIRGLQELPLIGFVLLWFTWMFSSLFTYWGPHRTAFRVLMIFGVVWGLFNIASNVGQPAAMAMQLLITTAPFFVLGWLSRRWPRVAGAILVALSLLFLGYYFRPGNAAGMLLTVKLSVAVMFMGPLLASGVALLSPDRGDPADDSSREPAVAGGQARAG